MNPVHNFPPYFHKIHSNIIFLFMSRSSSGLFPSGFPTLNLIFISHIFHACYKPLPSHPPWLNQNYKLWSSSLCSLLQPPATSSLFESKCSLSTLCSGTRNLYSSLSVRDHVSNPYKKKNKTVVLYTLMFKFFDRRRGDKSLWTELCRAFPEFNLLLIFLWLQF